MCRRGGDGRSPGADWPCLGAGAQARSCRHSAGAGLRSVTPRGRLGQVTGSSELGPSAHPALRLCSTHHLVFRGCAPSGTPRAGRHVAREGRAPFTLSLSPPSVGGEGAPPPPPGVSPRWRCSQWGPPTGRHGSGGFCSGGAQRETSIMGFLWQGAHSEGACSGDTPRGDIHSGGACMPWGCLQRGAHRGVATASPGQGPCAAGSVWSRRLRSG